VPSKLSALCGDFKIHLWLDENFFTFWSEGKSDRKLKGTATISAKFTQISKLKRPQNPPIGFLDIQNFIPSQVKFFLKKV
jgi:hypothetical protein